MDARYQRLQRYAKSYGLENVKTHAGWDLTGLSEDHRVVFLQRGSLRRKVLLRTPIRVEYKEFRSDATSMATLISDSSTPPAQDFALSYPSNRPALIWVAHQLSIPVSAITRVTCGRPTLGD